MRQSLVCVEPEHPPSTFKRTEVSTSTPIRDLVGARMIQRHNVGSLVMSDDRLDLLLTYTRVRKLLRHCREAYMCVNGARLHSNTRQAD